MHCIIKKKLDDGLLLIPKRENPTTCLPLLKDVLYTHIVIEGYMEHTHILIIAYCFVSKLWQCQRLRRGMLLLAQMTMHAKIEMRTLLLFIHQQSLCVLERLVHNRGEDIWRIMIKHILSTIGKNKVMIL